MSAPVAVKICGVTRPRDAERAVELGAAYLGLNFWPGSPRRVEIGQAAEIADAARGRATLVGVFVDQPHLVAELRSEVGLDLVQLHGDEPPAAVAAHGDRAIKVFRVADAFDHAELSRYSRCWGYLFDCRRPGLYGGTGESWPYELASGLPTDKPVLVAGGITPATVGDVLSRCRPHAIDVCSGVESAPGVKDDALMTSLFEEIDHGQITELA